MASGNWSDYKASAFAGGSGTLGSPYEIATAAQLAYLAYLIKNSNSSYASKYYKLTANIELSAHYWQPIGVSKSSYSFKGYFDGNGKTISGMYCTEWDDNIGLTGLFGYVSGAHIYNLKLTNSRLYINKAYWVGILAGVSSGSYISNIMISNSSGYSWTAGGGEYSNGSSVYFGGIIGVCYGGFIEHCDIRLEGQFGIQPCTGGFSAYMGGVVGEARYVSGNTSLPNIIGCNVQISNILSYSDSVTSYIGGVIGYLNGNSSVRTMRLKSLSVSVSMYVTQGRPNYTGGIIGDISAIIGGNNFYKQPFQDIVINKYWVYLVDSSGNSTASEMSSRSLITSLISRFPTSSSQTQFVYANLFYNTNYVPIGINTTLFEGFNTNTKINTATDFYSRTWAAANQGHAVAETLGFPWTYYGSMVSYVHMDTNSVMDYTVGGYTRHPMYILYFEDPDGGLLADIPQYTIYACTTDGNFTLPSARSGYNASIQPYLITGSSGYTANASDRSIISGTEYSADQTITLSSNLIMVVTASIAKLFRYKNPSTSTIVNVEKIYYKNASGNVVLVTEPFYKLSGSVQ